MYGLVSRKLLSGVFFYVILFGLGQLVLRERNYLYVLYLYLYTINLLHNSLELKD